MMIDPPIGELLEKVDCRYTLAVEASKRARELIGGSQREERLDVLESRIREMNQDPANYWWYLDLRRFGSVPHSGFGMGFERLVMMLTGISNIRDALPFPRTPGSLEF